MYFWSVYKVDFDGPNNSSIEAHAPYAPAIISSWLIFKMRNIISRILAYSIFCQKLHFLTSNSLLCRSFFSAKSFRFISPFSRSGDSLFRYLIRSSFAEETNSFVFPMRFKLNEIFSRSKHTLTPLSPSISFKSNKSKLLLNVEKIYRSV